MPIYYCCGHSDLTMEEFAQHYIPQFEKIMANNINEELHFIMASTGKTEKYCYSYLNDYLNPQQISIYCVKNYIPDDVKDYKFNIIQGVFSTNDERDIAMTKNTDQDIYWLRNPVDIEYYNPKLSTRTERNIIRRNVLNTKKNLTHRPDWHTISMEMCSVLRQRSTCLRLKTAAIIQKNNVNISVGYNGSVAGSEHCCDYWIKYYYNNKVVMIEYPDIIDFLKSDDFYRLHHEWSQYKELHGEMNAILQAGKRGISLCGSTMYTIYSPCIHCAKCIISSGIVKVYYQKIYGRDQSGIKFLHEHGILCDKI